MRTSRRQFLQSASAALVGLSIKGDRPVAGTFVNDSFQMGHQLRDRASFSPPKQVAKHAAVIVGGGIAGLSAAWRLHKKGFTDFVLLEMNDQPGGNSRWGENEITAYPWAAHYVPVPGPKAVYVRELFEDLGVLKNGQWEERYLCFTPQERLFLYGRWQEGIEPAVGLTPADRDQFRRLEDRIHEFRATGKFTVPMEIGLSDTTADLDRNSRSRTGSARSEWIRASELVHELLLPRRLWRNHQQHVRMGRNPVFRLSRAGRKGTTNLARRKWMDRPPATRTNWKLCRYKPHGSQNLAAWKAV